MPDVNLMPVAGMNNTAEDAALQRGGDAPQLFVRKAENVDVSPAGKITSRAAVMLRTGTRYKNLWQSPLHGDVFATLDGKWVKVFLGEGTHVELAAVGEGITEHIVLNNLVCASTPSGLYVYDGTKAQRLIIDTPPSPMASPAPDGSLLSGQYGIAVSWLRGELESAVSALGTCEVAAGEGIDLVLPHIFDDTVTKVRVYMTRHEGGELLQHSEHAAGTTSVTINAAGKLGQSAKFMHLSPMRGGGNLCYWRGRIITTLANVLRFSEAMAYHLHDERHGYIQMPQRITFVQPVDGGIWVGQVDHVVFLQGMALDEMTVERKQSRPPVPGSAMIVDAEAVGGELSAGGGQCAVWLAQNGYVVGTPQGQLVELHSGVLSGIQANYGRTAHHNHRLYTVTT